MTLQQKLLTALAGALASWLFIWPIALMMLWGFAELNGDIPTKPESEKEGGAS